MAAAAVPQPAAAAGRRARAAAPPAQAAAPLAQVVGRRFDGDSSVLTAEHLSAIGALYLEQARAETGDAKRFTDKMPSNFLNIAFIHLALPNARIIHTRRGAIDTCVSCFFTQFTNISRLP